MSAHDGAHRALEGHAAPSMPPHRSRAHRQPARPPSFSRGRLPAQGQLPTSGPLLASPQELQGRVARFDKTPLTAAASLRVQAGAPAPAASCACAAAAASQPLSHLRHPGPQHDVRQPPDGVLDGQQAVQQQRVVPILLRALDAAKRQGAAAETELAALKDDFIASLRHSKQQGGVYASSGSSRGLKEASTAPGAAPGRIKAFRPPGQAPPPKQALPAPPPKPHRASAASSGAARGGERSSGGGSRGAIGPAFLQGHAPQAERQERLQVLQQDNAEMRAHLEALYAHCRHLQRQLDAPPARRAPDPASPQRPRQRAPTAGPDAAGDGRGSPGASGRAHSPGRATVVVASPRAGGGPASLAVAVFEVRVQASGSCRMSQQGSPLLRWLQCIRLQLFLSPGYRL